MQQRLLLGYSKLEMLQRVLALGAEVGGAEARDIISVRPWRFADAGGLRVTSRNQMFVSTATDEPVIV